MFGIDDEDRAANEKMLEIEKQMQALLADYIGEANLASINSLSAMPINEACLFMCQMYSSAIATQAAFQAHISGVENRKEVQELVTKMMSISKDNLDTALTAAMKRAFIWLRLEQNMDFGDPTDPNAKVVEEILNEFPD